MPHSPRWHDERLWLFNSGTGELGYADLAGGRFEPVVFCPGYARGLAFVRGFAVVGLSGPRENQTFQGLDLDERLRQKHAQARCGILAVDVASWDQAGISCIGCASRVSCESSMTSMYCPVSAGQWRSDSGPMRSVGSSGSASLDDPGQPLADPIRTTEQACNVRS
jgi:Domain of unknown function (DUF4915)